MSKQISKRQAEKIEKIMAVPANAVWKLEDDSTFAINCFPARGIARSTHEGTGSWIVAYAHEQHQRYKSAFKSHQTEEKRYQENLSLIHPEPVHTDLAPKPSYTNSLTEDFIMRHHFVTSPLDLCSINIGGCDLEVREYVDFSKFTNVAYVNAAENLLAVKPFATFPNLRELELPVNAIRGLKLNPGDFPTLQVLDLSYNNLSPNDMLVLGFLPKLKVLTLTGNGLTKIHPDLCQPFALKEGEEETYTRFQCLEVLLLDDNHLNDMATFAALAALPCLKELNLDKNDITLVPYLKVVGEKVLSEVHSVSGVKSARSKRESTSRGSSRKSKRGVAKAVSGVIEPLDNLFGPDRNTPPEQDKATEDKTVDDTDLTADLSFDVSTVTPPFQQLRILSLANNKISEEEHLLAVAGWPSLQALILHGNPLVRNNKGEPPLLSHYLRKRLGISIVRFKPKAPVLKPALTMPAHDRRRVSMRVRRIMKQPVDVMIDTLRKPAITHPCPPESPVNLITDEPKFDEDVPPLSQEDQENIFLTQVKEDQNTPQDSPMKQNRNRRKKKGEESREIEEESKQLHRLLEDAKPDPDIHENLSIQGNVKMLRSILSHPLAVTSADTSAKKRLQKFSYREETVVSLNELRHDVRGRPRPDARTIKSEKLQNALSWLRDKPPAAFELPLLDAISDEKDKSLRSEAEILLEQIESKYRVVREESLRASRQAKHALKETKGEILELKKHIET